MDLPRNAFKHALARGELQIGLWSQFANPTTAEIIAGCGFDWIVLDMEHSISEVPDLVWQMQAMKGGSATPVIRPPWNDPVMVKRLLDAGSPTLLFPFVQTAAEARAAVAATRYPPDGIRGVASTTRAGGFGRIKDYAKRAASEICILVQVETREALERLEEIGSVDGVDGVFIGPSDLSAAFGQLGNPNHPDVQAAILGVPGRLKKIGKPGGILTADNAAAKRYIDAGYKFVAVGSDVTILTRGGDALAQMFKAKP